MVTLEAGTSFDGKVTVVKQRGESAPSTASLFALTIGVYSYLYVLSARLKPVAKPVA